MAKFEFGDNVRIKENKFVIDSPFVAAMDGKPAQFYSCYNGNVPYTLAESEIELLPPEEKKADVVVIPKYETVEEKIAKRLKGLIDFNADYVVSFSAGHIKVREVQKDDKIVFEDDFDFLNRG